MKAPAIPYLWNGAGAFVLWWNRPGPARRPGARTDRSGWIAFRGDTVSAEVTACRASACPGWAVDSLFASFTKMCNLSFQTVVRKRRLALAVQQCPDFPLRLEGERPGAFPTGQATCAGPPPATGPAGGRRCRRQRGRAPLWSRQGQALSRQACHAGIRRER